RVYQQALKLAQKDDYKILAADILRCQSFLILKLKNNPKDAEKIAQEALDLVKNLKNKDAQKVQASIFELLGNVYAAQGKENQALKSYQKGLKIAQEIQFPERIIAILGDIANTYLNQNQIDKAQELLEQALVEAEKSYRHAVPALNIRLARLILQQKIMR
ncbi:MAG: tetratricopeptide repeat protein, partial [Candidatus Cloacimonetes bacterium]|nr:tetratricopeptide repeat protein [Candidatus Cloacimonadota bacterium]